MHCMPITVTALATVVSCTHRRVGPGMKQRTAESGGASAVGHGQDARHGVRSRSMLREHFSLDFLPRLSTRPVGGDPHDFFQGSGM